MRWLFKKSKWVHKYIGLILILFSTWMSLSGMLMNHPELIAGLSVPKWLVPPQYHPHNWNRSSLITFDFLDDKPKTGYLAGKLGVLKTEDGGKTFHAFDKGFPASRYYRKTYTMLLLKGERQRLMAGTEGGLYVCSLEREQWHQVPLGEEREPVKKILAVKNNIIVFTPSRAYESAMTKGELTFSEIALPRSEKDNRITLVKLFFDLHSGKVWGLPGKLLFDLAGLVIIFLSVTAFYIWFYPHAKRKNGERQNGQKNGLNLFKKLSRQHNLIGIWSGVILLIIGATGVFMRPPLLVVIGEGTVPEALYPSVERPKPWEEKIQNALYDSVEGNIIIAATDGFWSEPADFSKPFVKRDMSAPVFVMGATVLEPYGSGGYLVGSFSGIYHQERATGEAIDMLTGERAGEISSVMPGDFMVTGYFKTPQGEEFITTHEQGLIPLNGARTDGRFNMPSELVDGYEMPLWNFLFELHNGRIFGDLIGNWYILLVPLGSILFVLVVLSGIYDWCYISLFKNRRSSNLPTE